MLNEKAIELTKLMKLALRQGESVCDECNDSIACGKRVEAAAEWMVENGNLSFEIKPTFCDNCDREVALRGVLDPHWVHEYSESVFCANRIATVGRKVHLV